MSDLCMYEIEDHISDEFHGSDDGVVPRSIYACESQFPVLASRWKKPRHEDMGSGTNHSKSNIFLKREGAMLERNSWPEKTRGLSPVSCDTGSGKDTQEMTPEDSKLSDHSFNDGNIEMDGNFCIAVPMLCDSAAATQDAVYNYPLNNMPQTENNLSFFDNGDKESSDLFYGWGDMGNFEDVDKMLRSCDSTFGLDSLNDEDDMCWFSSAQPNEAEVAMTDDLNPDKVLERNSMLQVEEFLNSSESNHVEDEYLSAFVDDLAQGQSSANTSDTSLQKKDILMFEEQANLETKPTDLHHLDVKSNRHSENSTTLRHSETMDAKSGYEKSTCQYYPASGFQQSGVQHSPLSCEQSSDQVSASESKSGIKSENKPNPSYVSNESYTSNQTQSIESLQGATVDALCKKVNLHHGHGMHPSVVASTRKSNKTNLTILPEATLSQKIGHENKQGKAAAELETSNMQESSCVSSVVDDISLEATSFRQLQQVIEQLDVRTKLCIRDSLYRLAKSAEQRHNYMNPNIGNKQEKGSTSHLIETDKYAGFMDMETDTNPIDRSIAHLLFHRPSDSSLPSENDVLPYKSHPMIPQPNSSPSLRIEKQEEKPLLKTQTDVVTSDNK